MLQQLTAGPPPYNQTSVSLVPCLTAGGCLLASRGGNAGGRGWGGGACVTY
jgi:hypothetical protein